MGTSLISNPPYNMKWQLPFFAQTQPRFADYELPPESNSNYAFILTAINWIDDKAALLLPNGILSTNNKSEIMIKKQLVNSNLIEAVIILPDKMFVSTSIGTCILLINKAKEHKKIIMVDLRKSYHEEQRDQNGQFGGNSHEKRTYHKVFKALSNDVIKKTVESIVKMQDIPEFSKAVTIEEIADNDYVLTPSRYIKFLNKEQPHRPYADIIKNINDIIRTKNSCKLIINESLAKQFGFDIELYRSEIKNSKDICKMLEETTGKKLLKDDYIAFTKNKNEICFKSNDKEVLSHLFRFFILRWQQDLDLLNNLENAYLQELRDALLPDLMSGKIDVEDKKSTDN